MIALLADHPDGKTPDLTGRRIHDQAGIADPVEMLGVTAPGAHVHDHLLRGPGLATVGTPHQTDIDVLLEISPLPAAHVVGTKQRALGRGRQRGDPIGVDTVIKMLPQCQSDPQPQAFGLVDWTDVAGRGLDLHTGRIHVMIQVRITLETTPRSDSHPFRDARDRRSSPGGPGPTPNPRTVPGD